MSLSLVTNIGALTASNSLTNNQTALQQSISQLSSGKRIVSAQDDPAGLSIAMETQGLLGALGQASLGLGLVLATPGDHVEFSTGKITVNGVSRPAMPHMPVSGALVVSQNHWFIWPDIAISGNWNVAEADISSAMLQMANVSQNQFMGKPFKRWFWRKQIFQ